LKVTGKISALKPSPGFAEFNSLHLKNYEYLKRAFGGGLLYKGKNGIAYIKRMYDLGNCMEKPSIITSL